MFPQSQVNTLQGEVHQLKDNLLHQKKRSAENMVSLLKDLNEIGAMFSNDIDIKVSVKKKNNKPFPLPFKVSVEK